MFSLCGALKNAGICSASVWCYQVKHFAETKQNKMKQKLIVLWKLRLSVPSFWNSTFVSHLIVDNERHVPYFVLFYFIWFPLASFSYLNSHPLSKTKNLSLRACGGGELSRMNRKDLSSGMAIVLCSCFHERKNSVKKQNLVSSRQQNSLAKQVHSEHGARRPHSKHGARWPEGPSQLSVSGTTGWVIFLLPFSWVSLCFSPCYSPCYAHLPCLGVFASA